MCRPGPSQMKISLANRFFDTAFNVDSTLLNSNPVIAANNLFKKLMRTWNMMDILVRSLS